MKKYSKLTRLLFTIIVLCCVVNVLGQTSPCCIQQEINGSQCTTVNWCNESRDNCLGDCEGVWSGSGSGSGSDNNGGQQVITPGQQLATYYFGHSLIYHTNTNNYPNTNVLSVPYWMNQFVSSSSTTSSSWLADGEFRLADYPIPPMNQWGFQPDISAWQGSSSSVYFTSSYNSIVFTELNFVQYKPPNEPYDYDNPFAVSPVDSVVRIIDYINNPNIPIFLYECWNDAGSYVPGYEGGDTIIIPTVVQRDNYYASSDYTGTYHQWWLDLYDSVRVQRPNSNLHLVPISPVLMDVLRSPYLINTNFEELFEDNSPHGRPSVYFLAALILNMGMTGNRIDHNYLPVNDGTILPVIINNFDTIVDMIYEELANTGNVVVPPAPTATPPSSPVTPPTNPGPTNPPPPVSAPNSPPTNTDETCCDQGKGGCSTVPWCNEKIEHCEGDCEGTWITNSVLVGDNDSVLQNNNNDAGTFVGDSIEPDSDNNEERGSQQLTSSSIAFKQTVFNSIFGLFVTAAIWISL